MKSIPEKFFKLKKIEQIIYLKLLELIKNEPKIDENGNPYIQYSIKDIKNIIGFKYSEIQVSLKGLEKSGLIKREWDHTNNPSKTYIIEKDNKQIINLDECYDYKKDCSDCYSSLNPSETTQNVENKDNDSFTKYFEEPVQKEIENLEPLLDTCELYFEDESDVLIMNQYKQQKCYENDFDDYEDEKIKNHRNLFYIILGISSLMFAGGFTFLIRRKFKIDKK